MAFVKYTLPFSNKIIQISGNWINLGLNSIKQEGFVVSTFNGDYFLLNETNKKIKNKDNPINLIQELDLNKDEYLHKVNSIIENLKNDTFKKLVFSRTKTIKTSFSDQQIFKKICKIHFDKFCYFIQMPDDSYWLGATPEKFIQIKGLNLSTMALAGTQNKNNFSNYIWSKKELLEHKIVVDYIENVLNKYTTNIEKQKEETVDVGCMVHLRTNFNSQIKMNNLWKLIKELHPTPAVCGIPKEKTQRIINEKENYKRTYYTGIIGFINKKNTNLYVNLRCMRKTNRGFQLFLGGGITKDSVAIKEWKETELKSISLSKCLE